MMNHLAVCVLLATVLRLTIPTHALQSSDSSKKCERPDNNCFADILTYNVQHAKENPDWKIPNLDPFESSYQCVFEKFKLATLFTAQIYWERMTLHGIDKAIVRGFSGLQIDQPTSQVQIKLFMPTLTLSTYTNADMKIAVLPVKLNGRKTMYMENVEVLVNLKVGIERRNGKDYMIPSDICVVKTDVPCLKMHFDYENVSETIINLFDGMVASNWKKMKLLLDPSINGFVGDTIETVIIPMFQAVPLQDIIIVEPTNTEDC